MKNTIIFAILISVLNTFAGGVRVDSAIDFTATDIHGIEHNLFNYLEEGNYVLMDFGANN